MKPSTHLLLSIAAAVAAGLILNWISRQQVRSNVVVLPGGANY